MITFGISVRFKNFKYIADKPKRDIKMSDKLLPLASMEKLLKQGGAERVSDKAKIALKNVIEDIAHEIASKSIKLAIHAGRKTVKAEDIKLAVKEF